LACLFPPARTFDRDLKAYTKHNQDIDPAIERMLVRFENFKHLLIQVHRAETHSSGLANNSLSSVLQQGRWEVRWDIFKREFLFSSWQQKRNYFRAILCILTRQPIPEVEPEQFDFSPLIDGVTTIRKHTQFEKVIIFPATIDFHYMKQRPQQLALAFAAAGYLVIYGTLNHRTDEVKALEKINDHLYLLNDQYFSYLHHVFLPAETSYYCLWPNNANWQYADYWLFWCHCRMDGF